MLLTSACASVGMAGDANGTAYTTVLAPAWAKRSINAAWLS